MKISRQEIVRVAQLARLELDQEQIGLFTGQLNTVLAYMERLRKVDTSRVEPTSHAIPLRNVFRDDHVGPSISREEALANAPEKRRGCFMVPKVI